MRFTRRAACAALACALACPTVARADEDEPKTYSPYELETIAAVAKAKGFALDPAPAGKTIESIEIVSLPVIEDRDPVPNFLNWFHVTSRRHIIERESLLRPGERWDPSLADETARNLRALPQLSLVLCVAARGSAPDRVRFLIITKDVWSIRLNNDFQVAGAKLQYLSLQLTEENLAGLHNIVYGEFIYDPGTYSVGAGYTIPRIAGSRVRAAVSGGVIFDHEGQSEGSFGQLQYGQPLYSTRADWAWGAKVSFREAVYRRFIGGDLATYDAAATPQNDAIPYLYHIDSVVGSYAVTRSFGVDIKHDFTIGAIAKRNVYRHYDLSAFAPAAAAEFAAQLPVSDTQIGPTIEYATYSTRFRSVLDFETLGLQEDYRLGHDVFVRLTPTTKALNSTRNFLGVDAGAQYTFPLGDGLTRLSTATSLELAGDIPDAEVQARIHVVTPRIGFGRLVVDAFTDDRFHDYLNTNSVLGGDTRPRGYPTQAFLGHSAAAYTFEYRTRPVEILACQLGAAAFFDAGDAFNELAQMQLKYSAGFGVRAAFPQLQRDVLRIDIAFPFQRQYAAGPFDIVATFDQAFDFPVDD